MFSSAVRLPNSLRPSGTSTTPDRARWWSGCPVMSVPSSVMPPRHGRSAPAIVISSVVLPAPFAPTRATVSPAASSRLTPNSAWKSS